MKEIENYPGAILFIDEIHTVIGAGATSGGAMDASNLLKPALQSGTVRCIGSTTYKEYRQHFEKDRALVRRFQKIDVKEPTVEDSIAILKGLKPYFEEFHKLKYTERGHQDGGRAVGEVHPRPQAARQGDRRDRRDGRLADAGAGRQAQEEDHGEGDRGDRRHDGAHPAQDGHQVRRRGAHQSREGPEAPGVRPGQGDRGAGVGDQAVARRPARAGKADRLLPVLRPDRRRQDRGRQAARRPDGHRAAALRHVGIHGEAHGQPSDRRAVRATSASTRAAC